MDEEFSITLPPRTPQHANTCQRCHLVILEWLVNTSDGCMHSHCALLVMHEHFMLMHRVCIITFDQDDEMSRHYLTELTPIEWGEPTTREKALVRTETEGLVMRYAGKGRSQNWQVGRL